MSEKLLTVAQVAEQLNCKGDTVRRHIDAGRLIATNIGTKTHKNWRIAPESLAAFLSAQSQSPPAPTPELPPLQELHYMRDAIGATNG